MIPFEQASEIMGHAVTGVAAGTISLPLADAVGRLLVEDVMTDTPLPPFTNAAVDGIAVRFSEGRTEWMVTDEITAGHHHPVLLREDEAVTIMTGAHLPNETDTVIPVEAVETSGSAVRLSPGARYAKGMNLRYRGEDIPASSIAVKNGTLVTPSVVPLLAACGKSSVLVRSPLRAAILATGDELVGHGTVPTGDRIRATNSPMLCTLTAAAGLIPVDAGILRDSPSVMQETIISLLSDPTIDLIITTGGISAGVHDHLPGIVSALGAEILFQKVNIKPGKPVMLSRITAEGRTKLIISLPGNPLSAFVTWVTLFAPFLSPLSRSSYYAVMDDRYSKKDDKRHFLCGRTAQPETMGMPVVRLSGSQSSGGLAALAASDCLIVIPESNLTMTEGSLVECIPISPR